MGLSVKRFTQRKLLYPLAIFAIIAPTVIMGLFGAYALRQVELRPRTYRSELADLQSGAQTAIEIELTKLRIDPPISDTPEDIQRTETDVQKYMEDFSNAIVSRAFVGVGDGVRASRNLTGETEIKAPESLLGYLRSIEGSESKARHILRLDQGLETESVWVVFRNNESQGFIAWQISLQAIERLVAKFTSNYPFDDDTLGARFVKGGDLGLTSSGVGRYQDIGMVPVHRQLLPDHYLMLRIDNERQFVKDDRLLSTLYVLLAVLCVPTVASATLMVIHMILREASEARKKVDFVSNVTHELKTPLTSIRMYIETLKLGRVKTREQVDMCLDIIMSETDRLGMLIDHVLSFAKAENQVRKYNPEPANLAQVVRDTVQLFKKQAPDAKIVVKVNSGVPKFSNFDVGAIREVVLNLLSNAIKYSRDDKTVTIIIGTNHNDIVMDVVDKGIGIDEADQALIFEKFVRVDDDLARSVDGTGLGLAICRDIVRGHKGKISVKSQKGVGSTFTVSIPYVPPHDTSPKKITKTTRVVRPTTKQMPVVPENEPAPNTPVTSGDRT